MKTLRTILVQMFVTLALFVGLSASMTGLAAPLKGDSSAASPVGCHGPTYQFFQTLGSRAMTVSFQQGCEPHFEWFGPAQGSMLEGRYQSDDTGYMWSFIWPEAEAVPIMYWQAPRNPVNTKSD